MNQARRTGLRISRKSIFWSLCAFSCCVALVLGSTVLLGSTVVSADEVSDASAVDAFAADYAVLKKAKDADLAAAENLAARITKAFPTLSDEKQQVALVDLVGKFSKLDRSNRFLHLSIETLADLGHPRGARFLKRHIRMRGGDDSSDTLKIAIRACAKVPDRSLISGLLKAYEDSDVMSVRVMACDALGHFRSVKRYRAKILKSLIDVVKRVRPSAGYRTGQIQNLEKGRRAGSSGGELWAALSPVLPRSLNLLTGQSIQSLDQWFAAFDDNRRSLKSLFVALNRNDD